MHVTVNCHFILIYIYICFLETGLEFFEIIIHFSAASVNFEGYTFHRTYMFFSLKCFVWVLLNTFLLYTGELFIQSTVHIHLLLHHRSMLSAGVQAQDCLLYTDLCFPPITCCALQNFQESVLPPLHATACSALDVKSRLTQMSNRREIDWGSGGWVANCVLVLVTSILHGKWHAGAFASMRLLSTFFYPPFFYLFSLLYPALPSGFLIFTSLSCGFHPRRRQMHHRRFKAL